jgi:broad specificity phosphatase PhoE
MLILVRHGQTAANAAGLFLGRADPPLSELGRRQASALAAALPIPARVVSSPLERARDTAAAFGVPVEIDERWIEMDYGRLDEQPVASLAPSARERWRSDVTHAPEGGESLVSVGRRVREACEALTPDARVADLVVVSHVSPIKAAIAWALGTGDEIAWRMYVDDAAVCRISIEPDGPMLRSFNESFPPVPVAEDP